MLLVGQWGRSVLLTMTAVAAALQCTHDKLSRGVVGSNYHTQALQWPVGRACAGVPHEGVQNPPGLHNIDARAEPPAAPVGLLLLLLPLLAAAAGPKLGKTAFPPPVCARLPGAGLVPGLAACIVTGGVSACSSPARVMPTFHRKLAHSPGSLMLKTQAACLWLLQVYLA